MAILSLFIGLLLGLVKEPPAQPQPDPRFTGTVLVLNKAAATITMLDRLTGDKRAEVAVGDGPHEVALSPDGATAVVSNYGDTKPGQTLTVIDVPRAAVLRTIDLGEYRRPHGVQFLPCGKRVAVTTEVNQAMLIVDVELGKVQSAHRTDQKGSHMVVLSADAARAYVANVGSGTASVLDLKENTTLATIETGAGAEGLDLTPDGRELWVANNKAGTVSIIDTAALEVKQTLDCPGYPIRVKLTPDGAHALMSCAQSGEVAVFDVPARKEIRRIDIRGEETLPAQGPFGDSPVPIGITIDGARAFVSSGRTGEVVVIELKNWTIKHRWKSGPAPDGIGWTTAVSAAAPVMPARVE